LFIGSEFKEKVLERGNDIVVTVKIKILFFYLKHDKYIYIYLLSNIVCLLLMYKCNSVLLDA